MEINAKKKIKSSNINLEIVITKYTKEFLAFFASFPEIIFFVAINTNFHN
jgi:hypothetical protein